MQLQSTVGDIAGIEEITSFASNNGVTLSFTTFGPGTYLLRDLTFANEHSTSYLTTQSINTIIQRLQRRSRYKK